METRRAPTAINEMVIPSIGNVSSRDIDNSFQYETIMFGSEKISDIKLPKLD